MKNLSWVAAVVTATLFVASGCTDSGPDGPSVVSSVAPVIETVNCPVESAVAPTDWPLALPASLVVTDFIVNGNTYIARGVSNDGELLLNATLEETLADFESSEPDGGASDVIVTFESASADGSLSMVDEDGDDCWDVDLTISFLGDPEPGQLVPTDSGAGSDGVAGSESDRDRAVGTSVGTAAATTARGTFQLSVVACQLTPVLVEAVAAEGELRLEEDSSGRVAITWTYADGTVVNDDDAKAVISSATTGLIVGDGEGIEGPETVIADVACDAG